MSLSDDSYDADTEAELTEYVIDQFKGLSLDDQEKVPEPFNNKFGWGTPYLEPFIRDGSVSPRKLHRLHRRKEMTDDQRPVLNPPPRDLSVKSKGESDSPGEPITVVKFCGTPKGWTYKYEGMGEDLLEWERRFDRVFGYVLLLCFCTPNVAIDLWD